MNNQRSLVRTFGVGYVVILVIANIIGSGVYKKIAPMAAELHSSEWILAAWIAGGVITLLGALSNSEVAGLLADTGGDFVYFKKIYNRFVAFIYGGSLFTVIQTATIASPAYVFAQSLNSILTGARPTYAMAREGLFFPGIASLNKAHVPGNSLLLQGIWSSVLVLSGSFDQLTDMLIFAVFIFYGATSLGVIVLSLWV
jgi:APA family basic amino acid/polyamine antiporter